MSNYFKENSRWIYFSKVIILSLTGNFFFFCRNMNRNLETYIAEQFGNILSVFFIIWLFKRKEWKGEKHKYILTISWGFCIQAIGLYINALCRSNSL